ncbi:hypothetical protein [Pseudoalteromonas luteoviolacea]|uniref:Uncharacterized protein n=1 Tax=Pseudoalteromonas luteoviolacea S4060-1 TaxID=1365257 RepID=A0A167JRG4_9GAMM|nr:hypothetical protein [Pseudoalteromonas luteoviolacea]KZN61555.1 hypothetical protein N478_05665 [Pseudoalteromonas luteoviolacea S4060-1]
MRGLGKLSPQVLLSAMELSKHKVFKGELNLNIIGIRATNTRANTFNDLICVLYQKNDEWHLKQFKATTDAGLYWRKSPMNIDGTAVLVPGQHLGLWTFGFHQGKYKALVQNKPVIVLRDNDKNAELETDEAQAELQLGYFGINCHRASAHTESKQVDKWSAGCQVFANPDDFDEFIELCVHSASSYGNTFSYTLLDQNQLKESKENA